MKAIFFTFSINLFLLSILSPNTLSAGELNRPVSLVTGGVGFIGAHVTNELIKLGHRVIVLDDLSGGFIENVNPEALFIQGSILDHVLVKALFDEYHFDYVYHFAAYAAEGLSHFIKRFNYNNNLIGTVNLINESVNHQIQCFIFTSSIAVYGAGQVPMKETMIPIPEDSYGIAKLAAERELQISHELFGLDYVIFRPHNVYGEYQNLGDKYRNVIGIFMKQLMSGQKLSVFGDGLQSRAFSYIGDIAPLIANCVNCRAAQNQIINIGADKDYTVKELATEVMHAMDVEGDLLYLPLRNEVKHAYCDHTKAKEIFGDYKQTSLREGLEKMATWAKQSKIRKSKNFEDIEIEKNLPPYWLETFN